MSHQDRPLSGVRGQCVQQKSAIDQDATNMLAGALPFPRRGKGLSRWQCLPCLCEALVLGCLGCCNKLPQTGCLRHLTLISHNSEGQEGFSMRACSRFANSSVLVSLPGGEQRSKLSHAPSKKGTNPIIRVAPSWLSYLPKALPPNTTNNSNHQDVFNYVYLLNWQSPKSTPIDFINIFTLN